MPRHYVGRFAPSPTGPLHLGSLICALASYLDARCAGGRWLVRMEDLDPPREIAGAAASILNSLQAHGLHWDGEVLWQSTRGPAYDAVLDQMQQRHKAFRCDCSRAMLAGHNGVYQGRCRQRTIAAEQPAAIRIKVAVTTAIRFEDGIQGHYSQHLGRELGDFVIHRKDGLYAYQLAVVVDDALQGITHVLRGSDLLDSTPRQIFLQQQLGYSTVHYSHIPVLTNAQGQKLSKQTHAAAIDDALASDNLRLALAFLQQAQAPAGASRDELLRFASGHWQPRSIPRVLGIDSQALAY